MSSSALVENEEARLAKLASARKKLKTFRASRSSGTSTHAAFSSTSRPRSASRSPHTSLTLTNAPPLAPSTADNCLPSHSPRGSLNLKGKGSSSGGGGGSETEKVHRHRRSASRSGAHRRQASSMSRTRTSVVGMFDLPPIPTADSLDLESGFDAPISSSSSSLPMPSEIITTPATPLMDSPIIDTHLHSAPVTAGDSSHDDDQMAGDEQATRARLSTFSFGSKSPNPGPPSRSPSPSSPNTRVARRQPLLPSLALRAHDTNHIPSSPTHSPLSSSSMSNRLSTPLSRPPSLLLTKPTPTPFSPTSTSNPNRATSHSQLSNGHGQSMPSTPPTPARKRHSHTRSNSISLPNLKLGRPTSLGVPSPTPSFPGSPSSPGPTSEGRSRMSGVIGGTRLKFEPSGRGAEAEMEKNESRRKALEKLTGGGTQSRALDLGETQGGAEIALPELDDEDEDVSSTASSVRPLSGIFGSSTFSFVRPVSLPLPSLASSPNLSSPTNPSSSTWGSTSTSSSSSPMGWVSPSDETRSQADRWSGTFGPFGISLKEDGLGFGLDVGSSGLNRRGSMTGPAGGLSVLAEEDETEEEDQEEDEDNDDHTTSDNVTAVQVTSYLQSEIEEKPLDAQPAITTSDEVESAPKTTTTPAPSRLRELQLASSASTGTPVRSPSGIAPLSSGSTGSRRAGPSTSTSADVPDDVVPSAGAGANANGLSRPSRAYPSISPTKGYGAIGRGRPRPLSGIGSSSAFSATSSTALSPLTGSISTPKSASMLVSRRRAPGSGSRGSSISYKKDGDSIGSGSASSRDWGSLGSKGGLGSPSLSSTSREVGSPPFSFSPKFTGWGNLPRASGGNGNGNGNVNVNRPCPRPRSLVGLGIEGRGSGRVLGEVSEAEEEASTSRTGGWPSTAPLPLAAMPFRGFNQARTSLGGSLGGIATATGVPEDAVSGRGSSEVDRDSAESFGQWRDPNLEMMMERDSLREDVQLWRKRCKGLEERLDGERKEAGVLRDRVRKLSDRLSRVSTSHPPERVSASPDSIAEMRTQLFSLASTLERERQEKNDALTRLASLEASLEAERAQRVAMEDAMRGMSAMRVSSYHGTDSRHANGEFDDMDMSAFGLTFERQPGMDVPTPIVTPATPLPESFSPPLQFADPPEHDDFVAPTPTSPSPLSQLSPDPNRHRMKAWGFPSGPIPTRAPSKRDSFFGLSAAPVGSVGATDFLGGEGGVDLPPFGFSSPNLSTGTGRVPRGAKATATSAVGSGSLRVVSEPTPRLDLHSEGQNRSTSLAKTSSSAASGITTASNSSGVDGIGGIGGLGGLGTTPPFGTSSTSAALSFLGNYLPLSKTTRRSGGAGGVALGGSPPREAVLPGGVGDVGDVGDIGVQVVVHELDFRGSCRCCVGEVIDL